MEAWRQEHVETPNALREGGETTHNLLTARVADEAKGRSAEATDVNQVTL